MKAGQAQGTVPMTEATEATVAAWRTFPESVMPLPHPSWRNTGWLKRHPWFEAELLPEGSAVEPALAGGPR